MRYVQRDKDGKLIGHFAHPHPYAKERVAPDHPDIVAWDAARKVRGPSMGERFAAFEARIAALEKLVKELRAPPATAKKR
jgi:hypothetical protein